MRFVLIALTLTLIGVIFMPVFIARVNFLSDIIPILRSLTESADFNVLHCPKLAPDLDLSDDRDAVIAAALLRLGCVDESVMILDRLTLLDRPGYVAFQRGLSAWKQGEVQQAASYWKQVDQINNWLIVNADAARARDINAAAQWYEINILSSSSPMALAQAITIYTERLRLSMDRDVFLQRVENLESYFGIDSVAFYRLRGTRYLMQGDLLQAHANLLQAIAYGMSDSETWYWLAESECPIDGIEVCISTFYRALNAPIQIEERRAWYLYRMVFLMMNNGYVGEVRPLLAEAATLSTYYAQTDYLATVYWQLGEVEKALALCLKAKQQVGTHDLILKCEEQR